MKKIQNGREIYRNDYQNVNSASFFWLEIAQFFIFYDLGAEKNPFMMFSVHLLTYSLSYNPRWTPFYIIIYY